MRIYVEADACTVVKVTEQVVNKYLQGHQKYRFGKK